MKNKKTPKKNPLLVLKEEINHLSLLLKEKDRIIDEKVKEIGSWQQRLLYSEQEKQAYRLAENTILDNIRNFYMKERGDFILYNREWKEQIKELTGEVQRLRSVVDKEDEL